MDARLLLPRQLRRLPADLAAVVVVTLCADLLVLLPVVRATVLRTVVVLGFVLFVPGYAFVAALFPRAAPAPSDDGSAPVSSEGRLGGVERVAYAGATSVALVSVLALALNFTPWGIRTAPVLAVTSAFTLVTTAVAAVRRRAVPADDRFVAPLTTWWRTASAGIREPASRTDAALNALLVVSVLAALGSAGYVLATPQPGEAYTEFYLLTEADDGRLVAAASVDGEEGPRPLVVGVDNHEYETVSYAVVVERQRVAGTGNETRVTAASEVARFSPTLEHGESWRHRYDVSTTGEERSRLVFFLYRGAPPADPSAATAYRAVHVWIKSPEQIIK